MYYWRQRRSRLTNSMLTLYARGLLAVVGESTEGTPDTLEVTEAGHAALTDPRVEILDWEMVEHGPLSRRHYKRRAINVNEKKYACDLLTAFAYFSAYLFRPFETSHGARLIVPERARWYELDISPSRENPRAFFRAGHLTPASSDNLAYESETCDFFSLDDVELEALRAERYLSKMQPLSGMPKKALPELSPYTPRLE